MRSDGVLSPHIFAIYMDDLIVYLETCNIDCHILNFCCTIIVCRRSLSLGSGLIGYGIFVPCLSGLCQGIVQLYCSLRTVIFGRSYGKFVCNPLALNDNDLSFVSKWKYLGVSVFLDNCLAVPLGIF